MTRLLALLTLLLAAGALGVAGCGGDDDEGDSGGTGTKTAEQGATKTAGGGTETSGGSQAGAPVKIGMENIEYVPKQASAKVGQKVDWTNGDSVAHTVTAQSGADFDSGTMNPGDDFSFTPTKAGTIAYFCEIHPNQKGTVTVAR